MAAVVQQVFSSFTHFFKLSLSFQTCVGHDTLMPSKPPPIS